MKMQIFIFHSANPRARQLVSFDHTLIIIPCCFHQLKVRNELSFSLHVYFPPSCPPMAVMAVVYSGFRTSTTHVGGVTIKPLGVQDDPLRYHLHEV